MDVGTDVETGYGPAPRRRGLRTGFTTGACAAAATKGACLALRGERPSAVVIPLPAGFDATFQLHTLAAGGRRARASVVKDAGDDPDVTHGAEIVAEVDLSGSPPPGLRAGWRVVGRGAVARRLGASSALELRAGEGGEAYARRLLPDVGEVAFVEMGEFTGHVLRRARERGLRAVHLSGMVGKLSKIACGHFMTHVAGNQVDVAYLADVAVRAGAG